MSEGILLSILTPTIPTRAQMLHELKLSIKYQLTEYESSEVAPVEHLVLCDNKEMSIGAKREALVQMAQGLFCAFADDDDLLAPTYCADILAAIQSDPDADVITFKQHTTINGKKFTVDFGLGHENEQAQLAYDGEYYDIKRPPYHVCPWRTSLAKQCHFPDHGYGEDWHFVQQLLKLAKRQTRIDRVLHTYRYSDTVSEARDDRGRSRV